MLIRTGIMSHWPNEERLAARDGAGLAIDGAEWLTKQSVSMVGADHRAWRVPKSRLPASMR